tara:strand:+ start:37770 stop:37904 length:135 start_codon:yes stop_codon:yes gene_type:complete
MGSVYRVPLYQKTRKGWIIALSAISQGLGREFNINLKVVFKTSI